MFKMGRLSLRGTNANLGLQGLYVSAIREILNENVVIGTLERVRSFHAGEACCGAS